MIPLSITARILQDKNGHIIVLLVADSSQEAQRLRHGAEDRLNKYDLGAHYLWQSDTSIQGLMNKIQNEGCQMLAIPGKGSGLDSETLLSLLEGLECPVLLVR